MPLPTLAPAAQTPIWQAMLVWLARAGAFFACTQATTVATLKQAYLSADPGQRGVFFLALSQAEYIVRRLLVAAALVLKRDHSPSAAGKPARNPVPQFKPLSDPGAEDGGAPRYKVALHKAAAIDDPSRWLPRGRTVAQIIDADAENFARRYLSLARLLADPDKAIRDLAVRFQANIEDAQNDVIEWEWSTRDDITPAGGSPYSILEWPDHIDAVREMISPALQAFRIHTEPG